MPPELIVATGDPQGIGPEVSARAAIALGRTRPDLAITLVGDPGEVGRHGEGFDVIPVPFDREEAGPPPSAAGGRAGVAALRRATEEVGEHPMRALVTAPLSKEAVSLGGVPFVGHTGWLGDRFGVADPVMLFLAPGLRVALATVHVPLAEVPRRLTRESVLRTLTTLRRWLTGVEGIAEPAIAVLALNPHAGEGGLLGDEEEEVLRPAIQEFRESGGHATGPHSADTWFVSPAAERADAVLAMYHDQGLIPVKLRGFGRAVNVTVGLPIIRTSVDHGCAFDIAGRGVADASSMEAAMLCAADLLERRARGPGEHLHDARR